jgi:hypothetical protein
LQYGHHTARCLTPDQTWCKFCAKDHHSTHSINVLIPTALIKQENLVTIFHPYATTVNYRTNLVPQSVVYVKNNFYSCAKDDKMLLKHVRPEETLSQLPSHSIILMANHLTITSFNSRKSHLAITSLFSSTLSGIFVITEPATHPQPTKFSGYSSISAAISFPHVLLYIRSSLLPHVTVISLADNFIHITLKLLHTAVHIFGIYGPAQQLPQVFTHLPSPLPPHSLLIGDFSARHPSWDPTHPEAAINHNGRFLRNQLDSQFLSIENDIFKPTHYPDQAQYHPTIIDLIISTLSMSNYIISTDTHSPNTPSESHYHHHNNQCHLTDFRSPESLNMGPYNMDFS